MDIQNDKLTIEIHINEAGGFGDIAAGSNLANYLSRDYNILLTFASHEAERKYMRMTKNINFQIGKETVENNAVARVVPFTDPMVKYLPKKPTIVVSQYNGEPYLYGNADFTVVTGLGIEEDGRYFKVKPEMAIRSGLYIKDVSLDEIISRSEISSELNKTLSKRAGLHQEHVAKIYKKLTGKPLEDSGWVTSYSGVLGIDGIVYDALADAVSKSESLARKTPVVLNFIDESEFIKNTIPACKRNGFNIIHVKNLGNPGLKVINKKSPVTVINFGFVDDELYEQAVKNADLMNVSAGDGSFSKGFSACLKTGTPFLKYYNRDQREFMKGLVEILRDIEACEGSSPVASDFFETFTANERIYKALKKSYLNKLDNLDSAIECRENLPIENISRLFYDEQARQEFYRTASQIPEKIRQRREEAGIKAAEVLPNAYDTVGYIIKQIAEGKDKEQILKELTGKEFYRSMEAKKQNRFLKILERLDDKIGYCFFRIEYYIGNFFNRIFPLN